MSGEAQGVRRRKAGRRATLLALAGVLLTQLGAAQQPPLPLAYQVPSRCPDREWFLARITSSPSSALAALQVQVKVQRAAAGFRGELAILEHGSASGEPRVLRSRELQAASCPELLSALAFNLSLFLDELSEAKSAQEAAAPAAPAPPKPAAVPALRPASAVDALQPSPSRDATSGWGIAVLGGPVLHSGLGPGLDLNGRLGVLLAPAGSPAASYEFALELGAGLPGESRASDVGLVDWEHSWWGVRANACPWGLLPLPWLAFAPCVAAQLGRYSARVLSQPAEAQGFAALEPNLHVRAGTRLFLSGEIGLSVPIAPLRVDIDGAEVFRQRVGLTGSLSLGLRLSGF